MSGYEGMRWFKCDLQVQTPEDGRHWDQADPLRLGTPRTEQDLQEKARCYLRRCHEAGLDVIGVTDHNFCSHRQQRERFLAHLIEQNRTVAKEVGRLPLGIFPGFEVDIGFHVLCLFPPVKKASQLDEVCDVLTTLGLPPRDRFSSKGPTPLRRDNHYVSLVSLLRVVQDEKGGLVIAAHAFGQDGIAADPRHAGDFKNEGLLCVEVSGLQLKERERAVLEDRNGVWSRTRPPARIRSSDAKSTLVNEDGSPRPSSIGYRWTWIKMSEPSIEGLRQAFLDSESRIRLGGDPRIVRHGRIESLSVQNVAFLADQEVFFSPHMNCLIGGRGSGKSSLFEYIRFTVRKEDEPAAQEQVARFRATFGPDSRLILKWRGVDGGEDLPGPFDVFEFQPSAAKSRVISREVIDPSTVFRSLGIQMFSQRQITEIGRQPAFLLPLIDGLAGPGLEALERQEREAREEVMRLQQQRLSLERLRMETAALEQEVQELDRRWQAQAAVQQEQQKRRFAQEAQRYLEGLVTRTAQAASRLEEESQELAESHPPLGSAVESWPESEFFKILDQEVEQAKLQLATEVRVAITHYRDRIAALTTGAAEWQSIQEALRRVEEEFLQACARQGLRPEELDQLRHLELERRAKLLELEQLRLRQAEAEQGAQGYQRAVERLYRLWCEQTEERRRTVRTILATEAIPRVEGADRPTVDVPIEYSRDREHFLKEWRDLGPDLRTRLGRQWDEIGAAAFTRFLAGSGGTVSPWEVIDAWTRGAEPPPSSVSVLLPLLKEHLTARRSSWEAKMLVRIRDGVDLILYRSDGSEAGSLSRRQLSEGQRNTALLMLLLASGKGPILIDQPEDELDSSFIFGQLVPLLRRIKNERQIIVVTHNPNLPVNGDAELVYALQAEATPDEGVKGVVRAQGGLDCGEVKLAVLDVMEGSEEAFRRRGEKYHF